MISLESLLANADALLALAEHGEWERLDEAAKMHQQRLEVFFDTPTELEPATLADGIERLKTASDRLRELVETTRTRTLAELIALKLNTRAGSAYRRNSQE